MNEALQEGLQITNNCIINTCKQPFGSWLINFMVHFISVYAEEEGSGCCWLAVDQHSALCPARGLGAILNHALI